GEGGRDGFCQGAVRGPQPHTPRPPAPPAPLPPPMTVPQEPSRRRRGERGTMGDTSLVPESGSTEERKGLVSCLGLDVFPDLGGGIARYHFFAGVARKP